MKFNSREELAREACRLLNEVNNRQYKSKEERKRALDLCHKQVEMLGNVERRNMVKERKKNMDFTTDVGPYTIKCGVPSVLGKYDFTSPDCNFYFEYLNGLDEFNQDWQIDEYEKLNKKAFKLIYKYLVSYINDGYDRKKEEYKQEILNGYYRRMLILCVNPDMTFDEYINLTEEDILDKTDGCIYEYILQDFLLQDVLGLNVEMYRKLSFDGSYMNMY